MTRESRRSPCRSVLQQLVTATAFHQVSHLRLVHFDAEAGAFGDVREAVLDLQRLLQDIGGQAALARSSGYTQLVREKMNVETRMKLAALQAYVQKYGIDQNAMIALKQIQSGYDSALAQGLSDLFSGGIGALATYYGTKGL